MGVSWLNFVYGLAALIVFTLLKGVSKPSFMPWVVGAIAAVAGIFFARSTPVVWVLGLVQGFLNWVGGLFGLGNAGGLIAGVVLLALVVILARDLLFNRKIGGQTFNALLATSLVAVIAVGPIANGVNQVGDAVQTNGGGGIATSIGG